MDEKRPVVPEETERKKEPEDWGSMTGFWKTFVLVIVVIPSGLCLAMVFGGGISGGILLLEALAVITAVICWMRNIARRQRVIEEKLDRLLRERS